MHSCIQVFFAARKSQKKDCFPALPMLNLIQMQKNLFRVQYMLHFFLRFDRANVVGCVGE